MAGGIFTLDLAGVVGWAHRDGGLPPTWGTWLLPRLGGEGARFAALENELGDALDDLEPAVVVLEAPLPLPAMNNRAAALQQLGLRAMARSECWRSAVPVFEIDAPTVRRDLLGGAYFAKHAVKRIVMQYCRSNGWRVNDHNAADALMLLEWYIRKVMPTAIAA